MLLACVPNVSLGPQDEALEPVLADVRGATSPGCRLLDVHTDRDHRRTVLTLAGAPVPLVGVLHRLQGSLFERASLAGHEGVHPRVGLLDVVPFVALDAARTAAHRAARATMQRLTAAGIPVYAYAEFARRSTTRALADVRTRFRGAEPGDEVPLAPDAGPDRLHPGMGAACVGVREPLVAYNVLLHTRNLDVGRSIASAIRARGGGLPGLQALAFPLSSRDGRIQVSTNLTDTHRLELSTVYERVREEARDRDTSVVGGELVGLAPRRCLPKKASKMGVGAVPVSLEEALHDVGFEPEDR